MKLLFSKISIEALTAQQLEVYRKLDQTPYGADLATQVALQLQKQPGESGGLYHAHRDYCGTGIYFLKNRFCMGVVNDGRGPFPTIISFDNSEEFINWLAQKNDQSMALYGEDFNNQTISKIRLEWYLDPAFDPNWNAYCTYIKLRRENVD